MNSLIVVFSFHHKNTEKVAKAMARILDAEVKAPKEIEPKDLRNFDLVGFGSGLYDEKHHNSILKLADKLPEVVNKKAFIFSTSGAPWEISKMHSHLREKLESKGYVILDEFNCPGHNTNSFLRFIGGMNKGRPNTIDLKDAEEFAENLKLFST